MRFYAMLKIGIFCVFFSVLKIQTERGGNLENVEKNLVPITQKCLLTVLEASQYSNIGVRRIHELLREPTCDFVIRVGSKKLVKREAFENYLKESYAI